MGNALKSIVDIKKVGQIEPIREAHIAEAKKYIDFLAKPLGSLGRLEEMALKIWGIFGGGHLNLDKKCTVVMAADNGVYEEGVASSPQNVTVLQVINMLKGGAGINVLSRSAGADVKVVDMGVKGDFQDHPNLYQKKLGYGTANLRREWAMSHEDALQGIQAGMDVIEDLVDQGYQVFGTGEMGIANTTTSAAIYMALSGCSSEDAVGKGAGLTDKGLELKKKVVEEAIALHKPDPEDVVDVLAKVGGYDLCGLVGCFLGAAYHKRPIVIDGVISAAAAYAAYCIEPHIRDYMIPSHCSMEPAYIKIMESLQLKPMLLMEMRLGEGSGCPLAFKLIDSAMAMVRDMATFDDIQLDTDYLIDLRMDEQG